MQFNSTRRRFLKNTVKAILLAIFFNPIKKLLAYGNDDARLPSWVELIDYARWCPTVHNLQPHQIKIISETEA